MAIFRIQENKLAPIPQTTFAASGIKERADLQRMLRDQIEIIAPDTLVIAEEFGSWQDSRRRIDLLAVDKNANLVVIELKRTEDGGHMDLQAIRYAAMVSTLTFDKAVEIFSDYLKQRDDNRDAEQTLLQFLEWDQPEEDAFASDVSILLASAEFSLELTSAVLWLLDHGIDIRCVRIRPYDEDGSIMIDVQQVMPLPEAEDYQVRLREKKQVERSDRKRNRDCTKFTVIVGDQRHERLHKNQAIHTVVKALCDSGVSPQEIEQVIDWRKDIFYRLEGNLRSAEVVQALEEERSSKYSPHRWFTAEDELIDFQSNTYAFTTRWGVRTASAIQILIDHFQPKGVSFQKEP